MQYILSREYMCPFLLLQKTSSSTIELSNHLLQATTNSLHFNLGRCSQGGVRLYTNLMSTTGNKPLPLFDICRKLLTNVWKR